MKSADVRIGEEVLVGSRPTYSPKYDIRWCRLAVALAKNLPMEYRTASSFSEDGKWVTSDRGVTVRYEDGHVETVRVEFLTAMTEEIRAQRHQEAARKAAADQQAAEDRAARQRVAAELVAFMRSRETAPDYVSGSAPMYDEVERFLERWAE